MSEEGFPYEKEFQFALTLVKQAAQIFIPAYAAPKHVSTKSSNTDLVTETDEAIETLIRNGIRSQFPEDNYVGEELSESPAYDGRRTWIIDPIDGTTNFVHSYPDSCISIGFTVERKPTFGVVYAPHTRQLYTARAGCGAQLDGAPLHVSSCTDISTALISTYLLSDKATAVNVANITRLCGEPAACHGFRMGGSGVLMLCEIAAGACDVFYVDGIRIWDMAAALCVLAEAGGVALPMVRGAQFQMTGRSLVAASCEGLARQVQERVETIPGLYKPDCQG